MTRDKANEFLKLVTGRKVKWSRWPEGKYIIPTGELGDAYDSEPYYWEFWAIDEGGVKKYWYVLNGFEETLHGDKWELLETFEDYLDRYHNE